MCCNLFICRLYGLNSNDTAVLTDVKLFNSLFFGVAFSEECHIRKRCSLSGHQGPVYGVAVSPNGKILASG